MSVSRKPHLKNYFLVSIGQSKQILYAAFAPLFNQSYEIVTETSKKYVSKIILQLLLRCWYIFK